MTFDPVAVEALPPRYAPATVPELLRERARRHPDRLALIASQGRDAPAGLTYAELDERSEQLARRLVAGWGLPSGATVAWALDNTWARPAVILFHAVLKAGLVNVPLNPRLTPEELTRIAAHAECAALVVADPRLAAVGTALGLPDGRTLMLDDEPAGGGFGRLAANPTAVDGIRLPSPARTDLASILYTSGTTGLSKGVEHTQQSSVAAGIGWADAFRLLGSDVLQSPFPIFGGAALHFNGLSTLWAGAAYVVAPAAHQAAWSLARHWRSTVYVAVPSVYQFWLADAEFEPKALESLRLLDYGGASMPLTTITALRAALPWVGLMQTYGLTEAGPGGTYLPEEFALERLGAIGSRGAGPFTRFRIVDEDGADVGPGVAGELLLSGPSVMRGYHRDPAATAQVLSDGWLRSGDVVQSDPDGFVYLLDRKKDLILRGGYNISTIEIENVLLEHPAVAEAAVFGRAHPQLGETVAAAVVPRAGCELDVEALLDHARAHLADFKVPRPVVVLAQLPRNAAGKVLKRELARTVEPPATG